MAAQGATSRQCPICQVEVDDEQWKVHVSGERCAECGAPQCAASKAHRPFCVYR